MSTHGAVAAGASGANLAAALRRRAAQLGTFMVVQALALFLSAGTVAWPAAWVYLGGYAGTIVLTWFVVHDPELFAERGRIKRDAKRWDKVLSLVFALLALSILVVAGLERRFTGPAAPLVFIVGLALFAAGYGLSTWAMASNRFFSGLVRIQTERGHTVATGGPYAIVRHPGYVGFGVGAFGSALLLGSPWALVPAAFVAVLLVVRTALEDRTLVAELPGYADYAARVRRRLLPGVW